MLATLSQIRAWSTEHLIDAAGYWTETADRWEDVNRPGMSGDSSSWKGWGHVRWFIEEVPAGAA